jgi:hypothetical protein
MTDPAERHLEERLHALARDIHGPMVPAEDDVRRGRRRLLRLRVAMAGATTGTLAVVLGLTALTAGDPTATEAPAITQPPSMLPSTPTASPSAELDSGERQRSGLDDADAGAGAPPAAGSGPAGATGSAQGPSAPSVPGGTAVRDPGAGRPGPGGRPVKGPEASEAPTDTAPTGSVEPTPIETPTGTPSETPSDTPGPTEPTDPPTVPPTESSPVRVHKVLRYYEDVLAEHLDPERAHLQPYDRRTARPRSTRDGERFYALGAGYRWAGGESSAGVTVLVASGWDQAKWECGASYTDWVCHAPDGQTDVTTEVAVHDGLRAVAVEHADGQVVVVAADDQDTAEEELVAAAADERLTLPGEAALAPPPLDLATFADAGRAVLVRDEETFEESAHDRSPQVVGSWADENSAGGTIAWSARPRYSGATWSCQSAYRACTDVVVDDAGTTVHVGQLKRRAGGGWIVQYDGASYAVRVYSSARSFPKKRAYALVTMADWQPSR